MKTKPMKNIIEITLKVLDYSLKALFTLPFIVYFSAQSSKDVQAQVTYPVDSLEIEYGNISSGYESRLLSFSIWEIKNGFPQIRDTIDLDTLYLSKSSDLPRYNYSADLSVNGTGSKVDTVQLLGVICSQDKKPIKGAGANLFAYVKDDVFFMGPNYVERGPIYTDENGRFSKRILLPHVLVNPPEVDSLITVLNPNKGEVLEPGSTQEILWENNYGFSSFKLFYSLDEGKNWNFIGFGDHPKDESRTVKKYDWIIPQDISSDKCLIKVEEDANSHLYDISDSLFSIQKGTGIKSESLDDKIPDEFMLYQNYPNPFNA